MTAEVLTQYGIKPTRFTGLGYKRQAPGMWSFYDYTEGHNFPAAIGARYTTKEELLADLHRFAMERGFEAAA